MQLRPFLLDQWIDRYAHRGLAFNLAGSAGPPWSTAELLRLDDGSATRLADLPLLYQPAAGRPSLCEAIAAMSGVPADEIVVTAGASEALFHTFFLAAGPHRNVIVPAPGFPPYRAIPEALGLDVRTYDVMSPRGGLDVEGIAALIDGQTCLLLVNTPHNPTGATLSDAELRALHELAASQGVQLVVDEVFHPIYHGRRTTSAATLPSATVIGDVSKALALPGLRIGWLREPDSVRRAQYVNAREYLSISNTAAGELLAEIAIRHHDLLYQRTQDAATTNLAQLEAVIRAKAGALEWQRPAGGTTAFVRMPGHPATRPFCEAVAEHGLLLVPGDCFGCPDRIRIGFGGACEPFAGGMRLLAEAV